MLERLLFRRPRLLNALNRIKVAKATSQTNQEELDALGRFAARAKVAVEIGSYQGVSAAVIAKSLASDGILYCVDPWPAEGGRQNPCFDIFRRHICREGVESRIKIIREFSTNVEHELPEGIDFAFIDGDHSWVGIENDWTLISTRIVPGGIICLHDTAVPARESWRVFDSTHFFDQRIASDAAFELIDTVYSMRVVRRL